MVWLLGACMASEPAPVLPPPAPAAAPVSEEESPAPLRYLEAVRGGAHAPLVVVVHGLGDQPGSMMQLFEPFRGPARVVAPAGVKAHGPGWSWFDFHWKDGRGTIDEPQLASAADQVVALADWLAERHGLSGRPVVTGFSQGGMISFTVAARHPDRIAAAVPIAGYVPDGLLPTAAPADPPPVRALHGDADMTVHISKGQRAVRALARLGYDATMEPFGGVRHNIPAAVRDRAFAHIRAALAAPAEQQQPGEQQPAAQRP